MLCTISIGRHSSVQGQYVARLTDGRVVVRVGQREYVGFPITHAAETAGAA